MEAIHILSAQSTKRHVVMVSQCSSLVLYGFVGGTNLTNADFMGRIQVQSFPVFIAVVFAIAVTAQGIAEITKHSGIEWRGARHVRHVDEHVMEQSSVSHRRGR